MKKVLIALAVVLVAVVGFIASRPSEFKVERSATMNAPADVVFAQVSDFSKWTAWAPWMKLDPQMKTTMEGTPGAVGHSWAWQGNSDVGSGKMTVTEVKAPEQLTIKLEFIEPFASTSDTHFTFKGTEGSTTVTWTMSGENDFMAKAFGLFMDMDKMIGNDFEKGLADLKTLSETEAKKIAEAKAAEEAAAAEAAAMAEAGAEGAEGGTMPAAGDEAAGETVPAAAKP